MYVSAEAVPLPSRRIPDSEAVNVRTPGLLLISTLCVAVALLKTAKRRERSIGTQGASSSVAPQVHGDSGLEFHLDWDVICPGACALAFESYGPTRVAPLTTRQTGSQNLSSSDHQASSPEEKSAVKRLPRVLTKGAMATIRAMATTDT